MKPFWILGAYRKTSTRFCRLLRCNTQVLKKNKHVLANSFIVFIDRTPVFWFTAHLRFANSGQNGTQDFFPKDHQRSDGADSLWWNQVSSGIGHFGQQVLGTQFFQVVRRSASIVGGIGRASHRLDGGGELPRGITANTPKPEPQSVPPAFLACSRQCRRLGSCRPEMD